jgi:hypothetical protein
MLSTPIVDDALRAVGGRGRSAPRAVQAADLGVEDAQVVGDLGGRAHGGARGASGVLLLQGHRRANALDPVDVGSIEALQEHAGVGAERLHVPPVTLGKHGVEGQ